MRTTNLAAVAVVSVFALFASLAFPAKSAQATEIDDVRAELEAAQEKYNGTQDEQEMFQSKINETQTKLDETRSNISQLQEDMAQQVRWEYKNNPVNYFVDVLAGGKDISGVMAELSYLQAMNDKRAALINEAERFSSELHTMEAELQSAKAQSAIVNEQAKNIVDSISGTLEEYEAEQRAIYGYQGGGPVSAIPASGTVVDYARSRIGCPYVWGAAGPEAFDCSGLVMWAYAQTGRSLPHQSEAIYAAADEVLPLSEARPGDVLWRSGHVGICTGYGASSYVHAPNFGCYVREGDPVGWSGFSAALRFYQHGREDPHFRDGEAGPSGG